MVVVMAPESVTCIERLASPAARKMPPRPMARPSTAVDGSVIARYAEATSSVMPRAPKRLRISRRSGQAQKVTKAATANICARPEPASLRAAFLSPAPSARDTSALMAIIMPTFMETEKNKTCDAKPTAAVSFGSPSLDTQRRDNRSTTKIAMSPAEVAAVMTITWRIVEPSVKTAGGSVPELKGRS
jgi:hypothetical protein